MLARNGNEIPEQIGSYWKSRDYIAVIDGIILKGRQIVIPKELKMQVLNQMDNSHMGIKKIR